jgi:predicted unusual protein kinase regulating ubiquinone biosynthesis (AarF/ABC1/UbiB family)
MGATMDPRDPGEISSSEQEAQRIVITRYLRVLIYFGRLTLSVLWWDLFLRRLGLRPLVQRTRGLRYSRWANRFRHLATRLGGIWIKVGQFLSARVDVLPKAVTDELSGLQDEVLAEPFAVMKEVLVEEFGDDLDRLFISFEGEPLASASLGQVHRAELSDGQTVVVKIQRPQIDDIIGTDLAALKVVIGWLKRFRPIASRADLDAMFAEFSQTVWDEIDYLTEAENARKFADMFADDPEIRVPRVFAENTTKRVLTLEDVYFIKITHYDEIEAAGVDRSQVAERLFQTYLSQIFETGFFHADPHPGNLFVQPLEEDRWRLVFVDFGMVGHLTPEAKEGLREIAIAVATRDSDRMVAAYQKLNMLLPGANLERIREAEAAVFDRYWGMSMRELTAVDVGEMHRFASQFRDLLFELPFQVPADLIFLGRCVAILSGMCTGLNPDFNLFEGLMPFAKELMLEDKEEGWDVFLAWLEKQARLIATMPSRLDSVLSALERGELAVETHPSSEFARQLDRLEQGVNRLAAAVMTAAFLIAGTMMYLQGETILAGVFLGLLLIALGWMIRG